MIISNKWFVALSTVVFAFFLLSCANDGQVVEMVSSEESYVTEYPLGFCPDSLEMVEGKVKSGQFFSTLLTSLGLSAGEAYDLTQACGETFDVRTLLVGNAYKAYYGHAFFICKKRILTEKVSECTIHLLLLCLLPLYHERAE